MKCPVGSDSVGGVCIRTQVLLHPLGGGRKGRWPSSLGAWNSQNVCRVLGISPGPLAKPDAACGACLCGETRSVG